MFLGISAMLWCNNCTVWCTCLSPVFILSVCPLRVELIMQLKITDQLSHLLVFTFSCRTQSHHRGSGQRREDDHPLSVVSALTSAVSHCPHILLCPSSGVSSCLWFVCLVQFDQRGRSHFTHHRQQRGGDHRPQNPLPGLGHRRTGESPIHLELVLLQHRGKTNRSMSTSAHLSTVWSAQWSRTWSQTQFFWRFKHWTFKFYLFYFTQNIQKSLFF